MLAIGMVLLAAPFLTLYAAEGDEMVTNPFYKHWADFKPGATVTQLEKTIINGPGKELLPDGIDQKEVTYKLLSVTPEHVVVELTVVEKEFLDSIESAPTKKIYPAKIKKSYLIGGLHGVEPKVGEANLTVLGKELACKTYSGTEKKGDTEVEHEIWVSDKVPGGIVKHTRVTKQDGKVYADTTITVKSFKASE
jgi:hypothetical protein